MRSVKNYKLSTCQAALAACAVLGGVFFSPVTVKADETDNRLNRIERELDTLNRAVYKGQVPPVEAGGDTGGDSGGYQANVEVRLSGIETQLRDLTGKIEQQNYENTQLKKQLDMLKSDMEVRMNTMAQGGAYQAGASMPTAHQMGVADTPPSGTQSGTLAASDMGGPVLTSAESAGQSSAGQNMSSYDLPASSESPTQQNLGTLLQSPGGASIQPSAGHDPAGQYEMAFSLMKSGNYQASRNGFDQFLKDYPDHPLAGNATYWIGEDYYAEGNYDQAARVFAESYKKFPKGPKGPDSLLKMGMSLAKTGKMQQSCVTLKELKKQYPAGSPEILRLADQEMTKLGCGG